MKIYQINVVCGNGSTGRIAVDLSHAICVTGGECRIAYGRGQAPAHVDAIRISNKLDLYLHALLTRLTDKHGSYSKGATRKLIKDIQKYQPDIVHLHNIHGYYVNYEMLFRFLKEYNRPVVWTMHDCWAFTGHCAHYDSVGCMQWQTGCSQCGFAASYPASLTNKNVLSNYKKKKQSFLQIENLTIVTPSLWLKEQVGQSFLQKRKCIAIQNGIDLQKFAPAGERAEQLRKKLNCENKKLLLGVASIWTKNKGYEDFLQLKNMLDEQYVLCMVGLTEKQIEELPPGIIGINRTESIAELAEYYSAADIFLNLTYEDTFPTTNIEALACGTPVLTYRTGGSPEIIDEHCGRVVPKGDLQAVMTVLNSWVGIVSGCNCNTDVCMERASLFAKEKCYNKYIDLYNEL